MKLQSLEDLLVCQIKTLRGGEKQIAKGLPKLSRSAQSPDLGTGMESAIEQTGALRLRLTQVADDLDRKCGLRSCDPVTGLLEEARAIAGVKGRSATVTDVALATVLQKLIRYRMVAYAQARRLAEQAGHSHPADLLYQSLQELHGADRQVDALVERLLEPSGPGSKVSRMIGKARRRGQEPDSTETDRPSAGPAGPAEP